MEVFLINDLVFEQFRCLKDMYPKLEIIKNEDGYFILGPIELNATYNDIQLFDDYSIRIELLNNYPDSLPYVYEESGKIPPEFEHFLGNGALCLGVENEMWDKFLENPTLTFFMNEFVVGYLYSATFFKKYGIFPFGERPHGVKGIIEYYYEKLKVYDLKSIAAVLAYIYFGNYRGHEKCPCGSGKKIRNCHGDFILYGINSGRPESFTSDLYLIYKYIERREKGGNSVTT